MRRVAPARTSGRPTHQPLVPGITESSPDVMNPTITVNNTALKPWKANAYDFSLEAYLGNNGVASIGVFRIPAERLTIVVRSFES